MLIHVIRPIPEAACLFVKAHEGLRLAAYLDSANIPTVGYGHTGPEVRLGQTIAQGQADQFLAADLATAAQRLEAAVGEACVTELTDNQYSALISFVLNVGCDPKWTICADLRAQNFDAVPSQLMRFVNAGGRKLQGLVERRADEVKLWSTAEPGSIPDSPPSSVTRAVDTPPTAVAVKPLGRSKSWIGSWVTAGLASASAVAPQVKHALDGVGAAIAPYVGQSAILQGVASHLALAAAAAAVAVPCLLWLKNHEAKNA